MGSTWSLCAQPGSGLGQGQKSVMCTYAGCWNIGLYTSAYSRPILGDCLFVRLFVYWHSSNECTNSSPKDIQKSGMIRKGSLTSEPNSGLYCPLKEKIPNESLYIPITSYICWIHLWYYMVAEQKHKEFSDSVQCIILGSWKQVRAS